MTQLAPPIGQVTFLFTDVEGSTALVDRLGTSAWRPVLERHRSLIRDALAQHAGVEIGTEGDSFFAVFRDAIDAVDAAAEAQRALAAEPWPDEAVIRVRMGIHTGTGELDADGGYVGYDVHRAARIASAASGGQVLLSEATSALVGRPPAPRRHVARSWFPSPQGPAARANRAAGRRGSAVRVRRHPVARLAAQQPARAAHQVHRARGRAGRGARAARAVAPGHADRPRRHRQDASVAPGRRRCHRCLS